MCHGLTLHGLRANQLYSILFMLETQKYWYWPEFGVLGWHIGFWNWIGALGFTVSTTYRVRAWFILIRYSFVELSVQHTQTVALNMKRDWPHSGEAGLS
jgi:hypothetical protein